jgi:hypothetical protein
LRFQRKDSQEQSWVFVTQVKLQPNPVSKSKSMFMTMQLKMNLPLTKAI